MKDIKRFRAVFVSPGGTEALWQPAVDVYRMPDGWLIKMEAAGVRLDDLTVSVRDNAVQLQGVRRDRVKEQEVGVFPYSMEIDYAAFERIVVLPGPLAVETIRLEVREGFILVRLS